LAAALPVAPPWGRGRVMEGGSPVEQSIILTYLLMWGAAIGNELNASTATLRGIPPNTAYAVVVS